MTSSTLSLLTIAASLSLAVSAQPALAQLRSSTAEAPPPSYVVTPGGLVPADSTTVPPSLQDRGMTWLAGLTSLGPGAWPMVREYVWLSSFAGEHLFAGYAVADPLGDHGSRFEFHLLIDRSTWDTADAERKHEVLSYAHAAFNARMAELNLDGKLEVIFQRSHM